MHHRRGIYHIPRATEPLGNTSFASATYSGTSTTATTAPHHGSKELSSTSKAVIGSVISCFGVAILIILGVYLYGRRRRKYRTKDPHASFLFDKDVFAKSASSPEVDIYTMADLTKNSSSTLSPVRYRESSSTSTFDNSIIGRQSEDNSSHKIANAHEDDKMTIPTLAFPKPLAEKKKTPRGKPTWLSPITTNEEVRSPPLNYDMSSDGQEILISIPPQGPRPPQKSKAILMTPTSPVTRQSYVSVKSKTSRQSLIIPDCDLVSVVSPARSESFAPKDLVLPSPPTPASSTSHVELDKDMEMPRLMSVVTLFTPNLPDELHVNIGDAVRIIQEYKDGWCFAQILGKNDAPKGVVPLVCLQERERLAPIRHGSSNKSLTSLNWR